MTQTLIEKLEALPRYRSDGPVFVLDTDLRAIIEEAKADKQEPVGQFTKQQLLIMLQATEAYLHPQGNMQDRTHFLENHFKAKADYENVCGPTNIMLLLRSLLYAPPQPTIVAELVKALEDAKQAVIVASDHYYDHNNMPIANKYNQMLSDIEALLARAQAMTE